MGEKVSQANIVRNKPKILQMKKKTYRKVELEKQTIWSSSENNLENKGIKFEKDSKMLK